MRRFALAASIAACLLGAGSAQAHEQGTKSPIVLLAGPESAMSDCKAVFGALKTRLEEREIVVVGKRLRFPKPVVTLSPGAKGSCDDGLDAGSDPAAIGRRFADWLAQKYEARPVDVVAVGASGLAVRLALSEQGVQDRPKLYVEDVVTVGSRHSTLPQPELAHPDGAGGTDWSVIGAAGDGPEPAAAARDMAADHKTLYTDPALTSLKVLSDAADGTTEISYRHGDDREITWKKAPRGVERIAQDLVYGVDSCLVQAGQNACSDTCRQTLAGWQLEFKCADPRQLDTGVTRITVKPPTGLPFKLAESYTINYALPLASTRRLALPIILPSVNISTGGLTLSAEENTLGADGVTIGTAAVAFNRINTTAYASGLQLTPTGVKAEEVELELQHRAFTGQVMATGVEFKSGALTAARASVGLTGKLGGGALEFSDLRIDGDGNVTGTLSGGTVAVGELTAKIQGGRITPTGFAIDRAELTLPPYLGGAKLAATGLTWDGNRFSLAGAQGNVNISLGGGKVSVAVEAKFQLLESGGYTFSGKGSLVLPGKFFAADAEVDVRSIDCPVAAGPCTNGSFLKKAALSIALATPIPLGTTGLALRGLSGSVIADGKNAKREPGGGISGVAYTISLSAKVQTHPSPRLFSGNVVGTLSTAGDFGLALTGGKLFEFLNVEGGMCVLFSTSNPAVCSTPLGGEEAAKKASGPGGHIRATVSGGVDRSWAGSRVHAQLAGSMSAGFVFVGGKSYAQANVTASITAGASGPLVRDFGGTGSVSADIGRFTTTGGKSLVGMKGKLELTLDGVSTSGKPPEPFTTWLFIDEDGSYEDENVERFVLVTPPPAPPMARAARLGIGRAARAAGSQEFVLEPGQTQTSIVLEAREDSPSLELTTPDGARALVTLPGKVRAVGRAKRGALANVYAIRTSAPRTVIAYLPAAQPGRWSVRPRGVTDGRYRLEVTGSLPVARLSAKVARRARGAAKITGRLRGADRRATVSLYAVRGGCAQRAGAALLSSAVSVRGGAWRYRWRPAKLPAGRYRIRAELNNGTGPLVSACAKAAVVVKVRKPSRRSAPDRRERSRGARARAARGVGRPPAPDPPIVRMASHVPRNGKSCGKKPGGDHEVPVFWVSTRDLGKTTGNPEGILKTEQIAYNDAAGILGTDPKAPKGLARTVRAGKYEDHAARPSWKELHWALYHPTHCASAARKHRQEACGARPFAADHKKIGPPEPGRTTCDEFPFASTIEGGTGAIIRGVEPEENHLQGKQYSQFLQANAVALKALDGKFRVCIEIEGEVVTTGQKCPK